MQKQDRENYGNETSERDLFPLVQLLLVLWQKTAYVEFFILNGKWKQITYALLLMQTIHRYVVKTLDNAESVKLQYRSLAKVDDPSSKSMSSKMAPNWLQDCSIQMAQFDCEMQLSIAHLKYLFQIRGLFFVLYCISYKTRDVRDL